MFRRAKQKAAMTVRIIQVRSCLHAFFLTVIFATLLHRAGDVERNPGPETMAETNQDDHQQKQQRQHENSDNGCNVNNNSNGNHNVSNEQIHLDIRAMLREQSELRQSMEDRFMSIDCKLKKTETRRALRFYRKERNEDTRLLYCQSRREYKNLQKEKRDELKKEQVQALTFAGTRGAVRTQKGV